MGGKVSRLRFRASQMTPTSAADPQMGRDGLDVGAVGTVSAGVGAGAFVGAGTGVAVTSRCMLMPASP